MFTIKIDNELALKFPDKSDAAALFAVVEEDRQELGRWMPWVAETKTAADEEDYLKMSAKKMIDGELWLAIILVNNQPVGTIDIHGIDLVNRQGEIGYWLSQKEQNRGIVSRALNKVCEIAFTELQLHRLGLITEAGNLKSQRVAEKNGFELEGTLRGFIKNETGFVDAQLFSKINSLAVMVDADA
ncbi:GNAT family N-acetyltransferase [Enterococcus sp. LJL90]